MFVPQARWLLSRVRKLSSGERWTGNRFWFLSKVGGVGDGERIEPQFFHFIPWIWGRSNFAFQDWYLSLVSCLRWSCFLVFSFGWLNVHIWSWFLVLDSSRNLMKSTPLPKIQGYSVSGRASFLPWDRNRKSFMPPSQNKVLSSGSLTGNKLQSKTGTMK